MRIHTVSRTSLRKTVCEDAFLAKEAIRLFGVFDGVTPLVPFYNEEGKNGAYIASRTFRDFFDKVDPALPLKDAIATANRRLREAMLKHGIDMDDKTSLWATCAAVVRIEPDGAMSFAQVGDCMILVERTNGTIDVLTRDTVEGVSQRAVRKRERDRADGASLPEETYYDAVEHRRMYNRTMANTPDGYSVANGTPDVNHYIDTGRIPLDSVRSILLITDGMFLPQRTLIDAFARIRNRGLENYAIELEEVERQGVVPSDDKTGIWICL